MYQIFLAAHPKQSGTQVPLSQHREDDCLRDHSVVVVWCLAQVTEQSGRRKRWNALMIGFPPKINENS